jgi:hypothetical protein
VSLPVLKVAKIERTVAFDILEKPIGDPFPADELLFKVLDYVEFCMQDKLLVLSKVS